MANNPGTIASPTKAATPTVPAQRSAGTAEGGTGAAGATTGRRGPTRLLSLTGMRFPAAIIVFAYHATLPIPSIQLFEDSSVASTVFRYTGQPGTIAVTFFFALSGFVLTWSARESDTVTGFWRRRFVKVYPPYVAAWALAMIFFAGSYTPAWQSVSHLFMVHVWIPDFYANISVNPPGWSLANEAFFYLMFPLLLPLIKRIPIEQVKYWIVGVIGVVLVTPTIIYALLPDSPALPNGETASQIEYFAAYFLPPVRIFDFILGILLARVVAAGRWRGPGLLFCGALMVVAYVVQLYVPHLYAQRAVGIIPVALLIGAAATVDIENRPSIWRGRTMTFLGEISFAFYLVHFTVIAYGRKVLGTELFSTPTAVLILIVEFAVSVLLAWALYAGLERPVTRRFSGSRRREDPVERVSPGGHAGVSREPYPVPPS